MLTVMVYLFTGDGLVVALSLIESPDNCSASLMLNILLIYCVQHYHDLVFSILEYMKSAPYELTIKNRKYYKAKGSL